MTYQQIKTILSYIFITLTFMLIASHYIWQALDLLPYFAIIFVCLFIIFIKIEQIKETTLCFVVKNNKVLMMYRNKKLNDVHQNKYNGLGGKVEKGESKVACLLREVSEEAGIVLSNYNYVGKVKFKNFGYTKGIEIMYCYVAYNFENEIGDCDEGELVWIDIEHVMDLPLWEGDKYFLMNIINNKPFTGFLYYENDKVIKHDILLR